MKKEIILKIIGIFLLLGSFGDWDYSYYQILKWYISGLSIYLAYNYYQTKKEDYWVWIFGVVTIAFNPIAPIYFGRDVWGVLDIIVGIILGTSLYKIDFKNKSFKN